MTPSTGENHEFRSSRSKGWKYQLPSGLAGSNYWMRLYRRCVEIFNGTWKFRNRRH
jgi:hypothetical protein